MSISILQSPQEFQPVLENGLFFVVSADTTNTYKFRYTFALSVDGQEVFAGKSTPNPEDLGVIDFSRILKNYTTNNIVSYWDTTPIYTYQTVGFSRPSLNEVINYEVKFGYEFSDSPTGSVTGFTGIGVDVGLPSYSSGVYKTFSSTMGVNGNANEQDFDIEKFVMTGWTGSFPVSNDGLFLTNSPRIRNVESDDYYTLAFTNYFLEDDFNIISEPYYVEYKFYDTDGLLLTATTMDNIISNGGGPRTSGCDVYPAYYLIEPRTATTYNTLYVGAGPMNLPFMPAGTSYYTVQLFGEFTGSTSPIQPTPTPTPSSTPTLGCTGYTVTTTLGSATILWTECGGGSTGVSIPEGVTYYFCSEVYPRVTGNIFSISGGTCISATPTPTPTPSPTNCNCTAYDIINTDPEAGCTVTYTDCTTRATVNFVVPPLSSAQICSCSVPLTSCTSSTSAGACPGTSATPTPTPTKTPTQTPTPSSTTGGIACYEYTVTAPSEEPDLFSYTTCAGVETEFFVNRGQSTVVCAQEGSVVSTLPPVQGSSC